MAALVPPPNAIGVPLPIAPSTPASLTDIVNAKEYVERLSASKLAFHDDAATDAEIEAAEAYKAAVIFSHSSGLSSVAPAWIMDLTASMQANTAQLHQVSNSLTQLEAITMEFLASMRESRTITPQLQASMTESQATMKQQLEDSITQLQGTKAQLEDNLSH